MHFKSAIVVLPALASAKLVTHPSAEQDFPIWGRDPVRANAASIASGEPKIPVLGASKAFQLSVHVMDKSKDMVPTLEGQLVVPRKDGYANFAGSIDDRSYDIIKTDPFFATGTPEEVDTGKAGASILINFRRKLIIKQYFNWAIQANDTATSHHVRLDGNDNTMGPLLSGLSDPLSRLVPKDHFYACDEIIKGGSRGINLRNQDLANNKTIPANCTPIRVFPECLNVEDVDERFKEKVEKAPLTRCYPPGSDYSFFDQIE